MDAQCYKIPIRFHSFFEENGKPMLTCNEVESIDQHIELLLTTCPGEHKFNKSFGCRIWDMDFERVVSRQKWEDDFTTYILEAVRTFEQRLADVTVAIQIMEVTQEDTQIKSTAIKKKVIVHIKGRLVSSNDYCSFRYKLYLGPLSTE